MQLRPLGLAPAIILAMVILGGSGVPDSVLAANSITVVDATGDVAHWSSVALDGSGVPVIAYIEEVNSVGGTVARRLKLARCGNASCTAGNTFVYPDPGFQTGIHPSLKLDAAGNAIVAYSDLNGYLHVLRCGNASCDDDNSIVVVDGPYAAGVGISLALDSVDRPVVAYTQQIPELDAPSHLKVLRCGDQSCAAGSTIESPDTGPKVGVYPSLQLDANGFPVVSYYGNDHLRVLRCGDPGCAQDNVIQSVEAANDGGGSTSMGLDALDKPIVAYGRGTELAVLRCGNPTCSAGNTIETPDLAGARESNVSMVLGVDGRPILTYDDAEDDVLKVLRCGVPTCASGNVTTTVDVLPFSSGDPSAVLAPSGSPVISYGRGITSSLKLLRCGNAACAPATDDDADGVEDWIDNCPGIANPGQENHDGNFIDTSPPRPDGADDGTRVMSDVLGDVCEDDDDNDGLLDAEELDLGPGGAYHHLCPSVSANTDPLNWDTDGDRVADGAECALGSDPASAASKPPALVLPDQDGDGLPDALEPTGCEAIADCDGDGIRDGVEFRGYNSDPASADSDGDGCSDTVEVYSVDGNAFVTAADLGIVAASLGSPGAHWNFDIDKNGAISAADLGLMALYLGASGLCS